MPEQTSAWVADVVVVGGGGSGLAAASEAAGAGARVILLEKNGHTGGTTSWSAGSVIATGTPHQRRAGITDTPEEHFEDLGLHAGRLAPRDNLQLRRVLADHTTGMLDWLMKLGVVFVGPLPEPPHRHPRLHNVVPNAQSFAYHLTRHCRRLGVDIRCGVAAQRLIQRAGRVVGVEARTAEGIVVEVHARRAVVLASGDYSGAPDLKAELADPAVVDVDAVNAASTGDGHRMALALGATVVNGDIVRGPVMRFIPPTRPDIVLRLPPIRLVARGIAWAMRALPQAVLRPVLMRFVTTALGPSPELFRHGALLVNRRGERFTDELAAPAYDVAQQPGRMGYIVLDQPLAEKFTAWPYFVSAAPGVAYVCLPDYRRHRKDLFHRAATIEALAQPLDVPPARLVAAIATYNAGERNGRPPIVQPPFYALGPVKSYVVLTDGGLKVSERLEVARADGAVIRGLYAAGAVGQGGLHLEGHGHHLGWAFISGRIAGRHAAAEAADGDAAT